MRQVAKELGVGQSSLYRYVSSREDLLDLMTDAAAGETDLGVPLRGDPVEDLLELALRTRAVQLRHPWLTDIPPSLSGWARADWRTWSTRCGPWRASGCPARPSWRRSP